MKDFEFEKFPNIVLPLLHLFFENCKEPDHPLKFNKTQIRVLMTIYRSKTVTMNFLSRKMNMQQGSLTSVADSLIDHQMIQRCRKKDDRRIVNLELTEKGRKIAEQLNKHIHKEIQDKVKILSIEDQQILMNSINQLEKILIQLEDYYYG